jgi:hypothetical protein
VNELSPNAPHEKAPDLLPDPENTLQSQPAAQRWAGAKPTWRTHLALGFVVVIALYSLVQSILYFQPELFLSSYRNQIPLPSDFVTRQERLLRCIGSELPAGTTVGFMTDLDEVAHRERYRITQYTVAPALVADSTDYPYIIGIFSAPFDPYPVDSEIYPPIVECGSGIYLLQNNSLP